MARSSEIQKIIEGVLQGERRYLSKAITLSESTLDEHRKDAQEILTACLPHSGNSIRVGITGVPGVGKSTYINKLGYKLIQEKGKKVAVLAIDPSSSLSGGSILGDKTRMGDLASQIDSFIRPSPTSMSLGGVTARTRESIILCEAAGFNVILVETVGVGQSETKVHGMVDAFLLLLLPGGGDELQGIKRGIVELADILVVNKADINEDKARETAKHYSMALKLMPSSKPNWIPKVIQASAESDWNINESWDLVDNLLGTLTQNGALSHIRRQQDVAWFEEYLQHLLLQKLYSSPDLNSRKSELESKILSGEISPNTAAELLVKKISE